MAIRSKFPDLDSAIEYHVGVRRTMSMLSQDFESYIIPIKVLKNSGKRLSEEEIFRLSGAGGKHTESLQERIREALADMVTKVMVIKSPNGAYQITGNGIVFCDREEAKYAHWLMYLGQPG